MRLEKLVCLGMALVFAPIAFAAPEGPEPLEPTSGFHLVDSQLAILVKELLSENPAAAAARDVSMSRQDRVSQARSLPDPQFAYRVFLSQPETRVGPQNQGVEISQGLPWSGKRELQAQRADHDALGASWRVRELERSLIAELKRAYYEAAYLQEALAVNADERSLLQRFEQIALTRYSTGEGIQQSVIKVQTDISRLADQDTALLRRLDTIERKIAALLGRPQSDLALEPIRLSLPELLYDGEKLESEALERNPGILADMQKIEADTAWVRRRHRDAYPDFTLGLGYTDVGRREDIAGLTNPPQGNGTDIWALTVKLNIPLYRDRIRAGVSEAKHHLGASRQTLQNSRDKLRYDVQDSLLRLDSLHERASLYQDLLIPQAEESLASSEAAYTNNQQTFIDLLDAERVLFQVRLTYHRLLSDYWIALADLERALARPFPGPAETEEGVS